MLFGFCLVVLVTVSAAQPLLINNTLLIAGNLEFDDQTTPRAILFPSTVGGRIIAGTTNDTALLEIEAANLHINATNMTLDADLLFDTKESHLIGFESPAYTPVTLTLAGNDAYGPGQGGGRLMIQAGAGSGGGSRAGLLNLAGGSGTFGTNGGPLYLWGGTSDTGTGGTISMTGGSSTSGKGGAVFLNGGMSATNTGGSILLLPGVGTTNHGNVQIGPNSGSTPTQLHNVVWHNLPLYLLNNNWSPAFQSPLNYYYSATYLNVPWKYSDGTATTTANLYAVRIGQSVSLTWETIIFDSPPLSGYSTISSQVIDSPFNAPDVLTFPVFVAAYPATIGLLTVSSNAILTFYGTYGAPFSSITTIPAGAVSYALPTSSP